MLISIIFRSIICCTGSVGMRHFLVDMYNGILPPVHERTTTISCQNRIPVGIIHTTIIQIMMNQFKSMHTGSPVKCTATTFTFCLNHLQSWIILTDSCYRITAFPLKTGSGNHLRKTLTLISLGSTYCIQYSLDIIDISRIQSTQPYFHTRIVFIKIRYKIIRIKTSGVFSAPRCIGIIVHRISLILITAANNRNTLFTIFCNKAAEIHGMRFQYRIFHLELSGITGISYVQSVTISGTIAVMFTLLHPLWRTPWRTPEFHIRILFHCPFNKRNDCLTVTLQCKMFHVQVLLSLRHFVRTIPGIPNIYTFITLMIKFGIEVLWCGIVTRTHWNTS